VRNQPANILDVGQLSDHRSSASLRKHFSTRGFSTVTEIGKLELKTSGMAQGTCACLTMYDKANL
jgi:hypothetical protein